MASVLLPTNENLQLLRRVLRDGGLVAVPTETVYGLAANAFNSSACENIYKSKGRPATDPLICHVASVSIAQNIASFNNLSKHLADLFWPGPLTLILPKAQLIPDSVTAGLDSVGVRCPLHPVFRQLIETLEFPLAAPSANPFAYISPTTAAHVADNLGDRIDYILDGGPSALGLESTIVDARNESAPVLLRHGALGKSEIEARAGIKLTDKGSSITDGPAVAPGSAIKHYSPMTPLLISPDPLAHYESSQKAYLVWKKPDGIIYDNLFWLSANGSLEEAGARLYAALHEIDRRGYSQIIAQSFPEEDIGSALNDRLRRAAAK